MLRKLCLLLIMSTLSVFAFTQKEFTPPSTEGAIEAEYQKRIKKEYLNRVYIPKDLADCFIQLNKLIDEGSKKKFKVAPEEVVSRKLHFSLGRWMMVNWSFYQGSRLSAYLKDLGIYEPDDMARFIIISYHRNLNRKELKIKEQITFYKEYREKKRIEKQAAGEVIHEEKRILSAPPENK